MSEYQINVGRRLRRLREGYQYTQDDIEAHTQRKIYRQFISRLEASADPKIQLSKIKTIAQAFGMEPADLFTYLLGEARKEQADLRAFLVSLGELSPHAIEDIVAYYNFRKEQGAASRCQNEPFQLACGDSRPSQFPCPIGWWMWLAIFVVKRHSCRMDVGRWPGMYRRTIFWMALRSLIAVHTGISGLSG